MGCWDIVGYINLCIFGSDWWKELFLDKLVAEFMNILI